jgi:hypothetical protein
MLLNLKTGTSTALLVGKLPKLLEQRNIGHRNMTNMLFQGLGLLHRLDSNQHVWVCNDPATEIEIEIGIGIEMVLHHPPNHLLNQLNQDMSISPLRYLLLSVNLILRNHQLV